MFKVANLLQNEKATFEELYLPVSYGKFKGAKRGYVPEEDFSSYPSSSDEETTKKLKD